MNTKQNIKSIRCKLKCVQCLNKEKIIIGKELNNYYLRQSLVDSHKKVHLQLDYNVELLQLKYDCYDQLLQDFFDKLVFLSPSYYQVIKVYINRATYAHLENLYEEVGVGNAKFYKLLNEACMYIYQEISIDDFPDIEKANQEYLKLKNQKYHK